MLALLSSCSSAHVVRLDTGQGAPREYKPPAWNKSVGVSAAEFETALAQLVPKAPLSIRSPKESISTAVADTLSPQLFYTVIATGLISWAVLAANPEPVFTKAAAIVSAILLIYLGVETFLEVVDASREVKWATDRATTWEELERASQRFANRVGPAVARVFVLAVTVVVSHGMTGGAALLASRLSMLPRFSEAAMVGASQVGLSLAVVGHVSAVAVLEGNVVITLAPTAVAMATSNGESGRAGHTGLSSD